MPSRPSRVGWAAARAAPEDRPLERFRGEAGPWRMPRVSISRLERYLDCPFRFFASEVLRLEEEPEDEDTRTPLERGRFLHELWERFFAEWQRRGHARIEPQHVAQARALFESLCEEALQSLSPVGSRARADTAARVGAQSRDRASRLRDGSRTAGRDSRAAARVSAARRLHVPQRSGDTRSVTLSAKVDRIDVLEDGTLRVIDYKSKKTPDVRQALQLPVYSFVALETLRATARPADWRSPRRCICRSRAIARSCRCGSATVRSTS